MRKDKKVLIIANDFPPIGGSGVQRPLYFAKYLYKFGWLPHVLTVKEVLFPVRDDNLLAKLPSEVKIWRTESFELRRLMWHFSRIRTPFGTKGTSNSAVSNHLTLNKWPRELGRWIRKWCFVPDDRILWAPFAIPRALNIIRHEEISVILATLPSYSSGVIGYLVSRVTGIPLIIDLRDPWTMDPYSPSPTIIHRKINNWLENRAIEHASKTIVISDSMRKHYCYIQKNFQEDKFVVITNGFDEEEMSDPEPLELNSGFTLLYSGSLYAHHQDAMKAVLTAWNLLSCEEKSFASDSQFIHVGRCDPEIKNEIFRWKNGKFSLNGYKDHKETLKYLMGSSALLLLIKNLDHNNDVITIPGKLFEYLGSRKPILMIGPEGDAANIVRKAGGFVYNETDIDGIMNGLRKLAALKNAKHRGNLNKEVLKYDRKFLTSKLVEVLNEVVG